MSQKIVKYLGIAGGGKTYSINNEIREAIADGVDPSEITVLCFNTAKADSLEDEFTDEFTRGSDIQVSTMHSKALSLCRRDGIVNLDEQEIIVTDKKDHADIYNTFFEEWYDGMYVEYEHGIMQKHTDDFKEVPDGNRLLAAASYCKSNDREYSAVDITPQFGDIDIPTTEAVNILEAWDEYKEEHGYLEHIDYLHLCYKHEMELGWDTEMLVIDEMQDYNPLMYGIYKNWRDAPDAPTRIVLAGDPAQSIYGFRAATSLYLEETDGDITELTTSRRCAPEIIDVATDVIEPLNQFDTTSYDAKPMRVTENGAKEVDEELDGTVKSYRLNNRQDIATLTRKTVGKYIDNPSEDEVYLLARTNQDVNKIKYQLRRQGIPYAGLGSHRTEWDSNLSTIYKILSDYDERKPVIRGVIGYLIRAAEQSPAREQAINDAENYNLATQLAKDDPWGHYPDEYLTPNDEVKPEVLKQWFNGADSASEIVPQLDLTEHETEVLETALARDDKIEFSDEPPIKVGTIHSSKGEEADAVILLTEYSKSMYDRYQRGSEDEERRLFYVGCTRARDGLYIVKSCFRTKTNYCFPPLAGV